MRSCPRELDVKGIRKSGNILPIKAIAPDGTLYGIKAISRSGLVHDIKGIKMYPDRKEGTMHGVDFEAHIKALPQVAEPND